MTHFLPCPSCQSDLEVYINLNEKVTDAPDECEECDHILSDTEKDTLLEKAIDDDFGAQIDYTTDYLKPYENPPHRQ